MLLRKNETGQVARIARAHRTPAAPIAATGTALMRRIAIKGEKPA
jgi:hypothetical protein